jgi:hypothetical protein
MNQFIKKNIVNMVLTLIVSGACTFFTLKVSAMISEGTKNNVTRLEFTQYIEWRTKLDSEVVKRLEENDQAERNETANLRADIRDLRDEVKKLTLELKQHPPFPPRY